MGWSSKRFRKSLKSVGQKVANVVQYAAPIAGTALLGPLGGLAGTAIGAGAATIGAKNKTAAATRTAAFGLGVTGAGVGLGLLSGAGAGATGISSVSTIFGKLFGAPTMTPALSPTGGLVPTAQGSGPTPLALPAYSPLSAGAQQVPATGPGLFEKLLGGSGAPIDTAAASVLGGEEQKTDWTPYIWGAGALLALIVLSKGKAR